MSLPKFSKTLSRPPRAGARWLVSQWAALLTGLTVGVRLVPNIRAVRHAEVVVLMTRWGHGHTITGPDIARRRYKGKRCIFIVLSEYPLHNWKTALMWPDITVLFVPYTLGFRWRQSPVSFPYPKWYVRLMPRALNKFARLVAPQDAAIISVHQLYTEVPFPQHLQAMFDPKTAWWRAEPDERLKFLNVAYIWLLREVPAPSVHLPERLRHKIKRRLIQAAGKEGKGLCCMYLRQKGAGSTLSFESRRVGSPLEDYVPGIETLIQNGYQVTVTGDVSVPKGMLSHFGGMLIDADALRVNPQVLSVYCATEADIFIGETGGGTWLPGINGIPRLVLNAFPYYYGYPNTWMFYKFVTDARGQLVPYQALFDEHAYDWDLPGMTIHNNSSHDIHSAIVSFLHDIRILGDVSHQNQFQFPKHTWAWHAQSKLSHAWLRKYSSTVPSEV